MRYYSSQFRATELNAPFYRTPTLEAVCSWVEETPDDFLFAWKASRFITHWKRLLPHSRNSIDLLETRLKVLGHKCGPVLFQLPPRFTADRARLAVFLRMLPKRRRYVFEFRHASWYETSSTCCGSTTSPCASPITMMRPHPGPLRPVTSICVRTGRAGATREATTRPRCIPGRGASAAGKARGATCSASSTTTRRVPHRWTPEG